MKKIFFLTEEGRYVFKENSVVEENFLLWVFFDYEENFVKRVISEIPVWAMKFVLRWMKLQESASRLLISICLILKKTILQIRSSGEALVGIINDILRLNLAKWNERKYKDYTILVHALKSSARIIGAENLSKRRNILNPAEISLRPLKVEFLFLKCGLQHWFWPHPGNCCKCFVGCNAIH